jgi:WD40 repeat protein
VNEVPWQTQETNRMKAIMSTRIGALALALVLLHTASAAPEKLEPLHVMKSSQDRPRPMGNVEFHPGGEHVLLTVAQEAVLWDVETGTELHRFKDPWTNGLHAHYSPDGNLILSSAARGCDHGPATAYDTETFEKRWEVEPEEWGFIWCWFSRGGKYAVVSRHYQRLLDAETGEDLHRLEMDIPRGQRGSFRFVRFSPDDSLMFSTTTMGINSVWEVEAEKEKHRLSHRGIVWDALFSPDGAYLVTASQDRTAVVWDPSTGSKLHTLNHQGAAYCVDISDDGRRILTGCADGTASLWNAETGETVRTFELESEVIAADLSPDGRLVLTGTRSGAAHLWDARTGEELNRMEHHRENAWCARFCPDGRYFVTASEDRTAAVYRTPR